MKSTKLIAAALSVTLGIAAIGVAGCAQKDPTPEIQQAVTTQLDMIKDKNGEFVDQVIESAQQDPNFASLEEFGIDPVEITDALLDGFNYSIEKITPDGNTATVDLLISIKDLSGLSNVADDIQEELTTEMLGDLSQFADMSEDEITNYAVQRAMEMLMQKIDEMPLSEDNPVTITMTQKDGKWGLTEQNEQDFSEQLTELMGL